MVDGLNGLVNVLLNALRQPSSYEWAQSFEPKALNHILS
jgi:hypothetical protein